MTDCVCPELCHQSSQAIVWTNYFPPSHLSNEYFVNLSLYCQFVNLSFHCQLDVWTNYFPPSHLSTEYFVNLSTHLQNRSIVLMFCFNSDDKLTKPTLYLHFFVSLIKLIFYHCISDKSIVFNHGRRDLTGKKRTLLSLSVRRNPVKEGSGFVDWWVSVCPSYIDNRGHVSSCWFDFHTQLCENITQGLTVNTSPVDQVLLGSSSCFIPSPQSS